jgi:sarcosine oxidase
MMNSGLAKPDVIVAGLGAMGAATLFQLAQAGIKALGIDAHVSPHAFGSSHGETRIARCAVGEGADYVPLAEASHRIWRALEARTDEALLNQCGCIVIGHEGGAGLHLGTRDFVQCTIDSAIAGNVPHEILDSAEITRRYPQITGLEGERACFEPGGGFVYPERCIAAQLDEATASGATIVNERILSISQKSGMVHVKTTGGDYCAPQLVAALGAWTAPLLGPPFTSILRVKRQVLHWFAADDTIYAPSAFPTIIWLHGLTARDTFYGFPALPGSGRIKMATEQYEVDCDPDSIIRDVSPAEQDAMLKEHLAGRLKGLTGMPLESKVCMYTVTPGSAFIIDAHPAMDRVTVISACSGHGFKHSAGIGEAVAQRLANGHSRVDLEPFRLARLAT